TNRFHRPLSMIFMDVDRFKSYNDSYGHQEGDKVLKGLAEVLLRDTRKKIDIAYRYGGEEFVVVLPETNGEQAVVVAERVLKDFRGLDFTPKGIVEPIHLTFSAGVTSFKAGEEGASLLERADQAMYQAKSAGRNRVVKA
ncbi:MAG TPA: GGDEF domain-containing protein, partial [Candidatus Brocadiales bacterium]|nr:GGDEF domain-containing protein [Candidatus Brocadiales bacterium]